MSGPRREGRPERILRAAPLNAADPATFYSAGPAGYTDYPRLPSG